MGGPDPRLIDAGCRVVVAEFNRIGARTLYCCDGHGDNTAWYVMFEADLALAQQIADLGYFEISLVSHQPGRYRMARGNDMNTKTSSLIKGWMENSQSAFERGPLSGAAKAVAAAFNRGGGYSHCVPECCLNNFEQGSALNAR